MFLLPIVLDPQFLISTNNNEKNRSNIKNFLEKYEEFLSEIFILIDDDEESLQKKYDYIRNNAEKYPYAKIILETFLGIKKHGKYAKVKINKTKDIVGEILKVLKKNDVKNIIQFPNIFDDNFIHLKKYQAKISNADEDYETQKEIISSITRFSKKIYIIDPIIPYNLTTLNYQNRRKKNSDISKVGQNYHFTHKLYALGLKKFINIIYDSSFYKKDLEIIIITTLDPSKFRNIKESLEEKIKNKIATTHDLLAWKNLGKTVHDTIKFHTKNIIKDFEPKVLIKQHLLKKNTDLKLNDVKDDAYVRCIFTDDINTFLEVRKGIDFFADENTLRKETNYFLRMVLDNKEKNNARVILEHPEYAAEELASKNKHAI